MKTYELSELIKAGEAARRLGIHPRTLASWSAQGIAPAPVRQGPRKLRFYRADDIEAMAQNGVTP